MRGGRRPPGPTGPVDLDELPSLLDPIRAWVAEFGDTVRLDTPNQGVAYVVCHPDHVRHVLITRARGYRKGYGIDRVRLLLPGGLMVSEGQEWQDARGALQPLFRRTALRRLGEVVSTRVAQLRERWLTKAGTGEAVDITQDAGEFALRVVLDALGLDDRFLFVAREQARDLAFARRFRALRSDVEQLALDRRAMPDPPPDLLTLIARGGASLTPLQVADEVMTLIIAGHETTASTICWTWHLLAEHPEAERRLHAELDAGSVGRFAEQVLREAMRLYPPGWLVTRKAVTPDRLGSFEIEAGADVLIPLFLVHRHPAYWAQPEAFDPDRFDALAPARHPAAYLPFGAGPRNCIGQHFAMMELGGHLSGLARRLRLRRVSTGPVAVEAQVNLRPKEPMHMRVEPR